jgi:hypothetical protein
MANPILTRRTYTTTFEEDHRDIPPDITGTEIRDIMTKNDFANVRKATLVTTWTRCLPSEQVHERPNYAGGREDWLYSYGGDLTVTLTDFDGSMVLLYERRSAKLEGAMDIHNQHVAMFYEGRFAK